MTMTMMSGALLVLASVLSTYACASDAPIRSNAPAGATSVEDPKPRDEAKPKTEDAKASPSVEKGDKAEVGKPAPDFVLKDIDGKEVKLSSFKGKKVALEWFSPGCPMCVWAYGEGPLKEMPGRYKEKGVVWLAINSEDPANKPSQPEANKAFVEKYKMKSPILLDPTGAVGKAYAAKTTPHLYLIDEKGILQYRGALDNAPGSQAPTDGVVVNYVDAAIKDLEAGRKVATPETKSYG